MGEVAEEGRTVLFVSHNMAAIAGLCSRCLCLQDGQTLMDGGADEVVSRYLIGSKQSEDQRLAERKDRRGDGVVRITGINFFDAQSREQLDLAISGQGLDIEVSYKANDRSLGRIGRFNIGLALSSYFGQRITILNSEQSNRAFEDLPPEGCVHCRIPRLSLMGGSYSITCTLQINGRLADQVTDAGVLHVEAGDFYGTGISASHHRHGVYLDHEWYAVSST